MDDFSKMLLTAVATTIGAIFVFVVTQLFGKLILEAVQDFRRLLGEIRYALVFHAQAIFTPVGDVRGEDDDASKTFRRLSCELRSRAESIPLYDFWSRLSGRFRVFEAARDLMGLSNSVHGDTRPQTNGALVNKIETLLELEPLEASRYAP